MYALRLILLGTAFLFSFHFGETYTWYKGEQRLTEFQSQYANSKADIFFLMDNSGSLLSNSQDGFADEKIFITSLLERIKIAKPASRVAVIRFGDHATIDINYVSNITGQNNKCEFNKRFAGIHYTGYWTNMNEAFAKVEEILFGPQSTDVRPWRVNNPKGVYVNKVVFLLTDGEYNVGGSPIGKINHIKRNHVELFAVGVSRANPTFLRSVATSSDHYFYYKDFNEFRELATHIRGGKVNMSLVELSKGCFTHFNRHHRQNILDTTPFFKKICRKKLYLEVHFTLDFSVDSLMTKHNSIFSFQFSSPQETTVSVINFTDLYRSLPKGQ